MDNLTPINAMIQSFKDNHPVLLGLLLVVLAVIYAYYEYQDYKRG